MLYVNVIEKPQKQNTATNYSLHFDFNECFDYCVFFTITAGIHLLKLTQ